MAYKKSKNSDVTEEEKEESDNPCSDYQINETETASVKDFGSVIIKNGHTIHCLTVIGQIEGHTVLPPQNKTTKYEHVIPQLVAAEESSDIDGLLILLNTSGGDVEAGLAIAEVIAGMKKPVVSIILGGGHCIGIPLAVAAKYSYIARSASMTVHPVRSNGLMLGVPQTFEYFRKMQNRITAFVSDNSEISNKRYNELVMNTEELVLDVGTVLEGDKAVEEGLINKVGTVRDALDRLYKMIDERKSSVGKRKR